MTSEICLQMVRILSFTHVWIAGAAGWMTWASTTMLDTSQAHDPWCIWIGLSTGLGYTVQRWIKFRLDAGSMPPMRQLFWSKGGSLMLIAWGVAWLAFTGWHWFELHLTSKIPWLITLCMLGLLYAIVPGRSQGLRAYPWFKIPMIATAWALATTPVWESSSVWLMASRWLLIAGLTLPFDVRDIKIDSTRILTVPMAWGVNPALKVSCGLLLLSSVMLAPYVVPNFKDPSIFLAIQGLIAAALISQTRVQQTLTEGSERTREQWTGLVLDGILWIPGLGMVLGII